MALKRLGVGVDVIDEEAPLDGYRIVAAPMLYMLSGGITEKLKHFVAEGGSLILTYGTGEVNENDLCYLGGFPGDGLMEIAGIRAEEMDVLCDNEKNGLKLYGNGKTYEIDSYCEIIHPNDSCEVLADYTEDFYAGNAVVTRNTYGKGECIYIAARAEQAFLDDILAECAGRQEIELLWSNLPEGIDIAVRENEEAEYCFIMNFMGKGIDLALPDALKGSFDMLSGETVSELMFDRYGYAILKKDKIQEKTDGTF